MLDSKRILELIRYPSKATDEEKTQLLDLTNLYAYSAIIKIINAKVASVNQSADAGKFITSAAIATVDRINLKKYIQSEDWAISTDTHTGMQETEISVREEPVDESEALPHEAEPAVEEKPEEALNVTSQSEAVLTETDNTGENQQIEEKEPAEPDEKTEAGAHETGPVLSTSQENDRDTAEIDQKEDEIDQSEADTELKSDDTIRQTEEMKVHTVDMNQENAVEEVKEKWEEQLQSAGEPGKDETAENEGAIGNQTGDQDTQELEKPVSEITDDPSTGEERDVEDQDKKIPDLSGEKHEVLTGDQGENTPDPDGPLSSDLLKNISEYRKNREFFEKMLQDGDHKKEHERIKKDKKPSAGKKKTGKKTGKKDEKKPAAGREESEGIKKNAEKTGQKIKSIKEASAPQEKEVKTAQKEEGPETAAETGDKSKPAETGTGPDPAIDDTHYPVEIANDLEKVTEEKKSEGYPVNEEEDPEVIREFLEKLNPEPPENESQKKLKKEEQEKIIENFINSEPRIKNVKEPKKLKEREDLSLPSVKFRDDLVSENLASIMISQGKTDQAIDIYKKLIWKFPQKKSYFASQIEELKKK